jgi:hypothetical protein
MTPHGTYDEEPEVLTTSTVGTRISVWGAVWQ